MATQGRRRAFGQHFLKDTQAAQLIADTAFEEANQHSCSQLLEIGPGRGAITNPLLNGLPAHPGIKKFLIVERDRKIAEYWSHETAALGPIQVESEDFLQLPDEKWLPTSTNESLAVVSNLPYSAGTAILDRLARNYRVIPVMVLMFQAEVAQRLYAEASTPDRGSLSLWIQNRWDVRRILHVPPQAFVPPPQVDSEVVVLTRRNQPQVQVPEDPASEALWEKVLKSAFAQRRKMLRSSFPWRNALELSGVDGTKRAEALNWQEWESLYQAVRKVTELPRAT